MAVDGQMPLKLSLEAGADLSASQYKFVKLGSGRTVVAVAAATDVPIGVLQNKPTASGQMAEVVVLGVTKLQADAALATVGTVIGTSADGQADAKVVGDTTEFALGRTLSTSGAAGEVIEAVINCILPLTAESAF